MEITTRQQAKELGLKRYFTGKPCKNGHVEERILSSGECMECARIKHRDMDKWGTISTENMEDSLCCVCGSKIPDTMRIDAIYCSISCGNRRRNKKYYQLNPELFKQKRLTQNGFVQKRIFSRIKCRALKNGIPFNLNVADIVIPEYCPILGIKLVTNAGKGAKNHPDSASVDRIDPKLGYVKGNVRVISARANLLKSNAEIWELEKILEDLRETRGRFGK